MINIDGKLLEVIKRRTEGSNGWLSFGSNFDLFGDALRLLFSEAIPSFLFLLDDNPFFS
jgi:hypothetical protein